MNQEFAQKIGVIWAKSGEEQGHALLAHMLDVAAVAEMILETEPESTRSWAAQQFGVDLAHVQRWLAALAGLHDFGKAIPGFQAKWLIGMNKALVVGLRFIKSACGVTRHDLATAALLGQPLSKLASAKPLWVHQATLAVSAHHGYHFLPAEVNDGRPLNEPPEWAQVRQEILQRYWQLMAPAGEALQEELSLPAINWLAGLTSAADWIASNPEWFALGDRGFDDLQSYYQDAKRLARVALGRIGWYEFRPLLEQDADTDALLARIVGRSGLTARPLQQAGDQLLESAKGPALLLVEAPMGEGKTELALLAYLRLQQLNGHRGLYVALPTQATGNALFKRVLVFLAHFSSGAIDVQLVHGGAAMNEDVQHLRGINHSREDSISASAWFSQRRRPLLSAYGVGTVDQALFAVLNVKHHFVRLWGLSNRVVVLDEVHAYDTYTSGLIAALLRWLKAMGCSVILMSATLPVARRTELLRAWGIDESQAPDLPYPRLMLVDGQGVRGAHFGARPLAPIHLKGLGDSLEEMADAVVELLAAGGCGAIIVNTVDRAQTLHVMLAQRLGAEVSLWLFHARFPADERSECEREVLKTFGQQGVRPHKGLLIATQVAEQSLDIDFDFMLSDLAPVDLLLQRAGRLHRHMRERPMRHAQACLWVAGLKDRDVLPELKQTAWGYVYEPYTLLRTWALLRDVQQLNLPADIDRLVQVVYDEDALPDDLQEKVRDIIEIETYGEYLGRVKSERTMSFNISIDPSEELSTAYSGKPRGNEEGEGIGLENKTRMGRESITLIPVHEVAGGWCVRLGETVFSPEQTLSDALARQLYDRQLKVSRAAVVKCLKAKELPMAFDHPLLRNCYPLPLSDGCYVQNGLALRLDGRLGLMYKPGEKSDKEVE